MAQQAEAQNEEKLLITSMTVVHKAAVQNRMDLALERKANFFQNKQHTSQQQSTCIKGMRLSTEQCVLYCLELERVEWHSINPTENARWHISKERYLLRTEQRLAQSPCHSLRSRVCYLHHLAV